jgi:hypothetical protein
MQAKTAIIRLHLESLLRTVAHLRRATRLSLAFEVEALTAPCAVESTDTIILDALAVDGYCKSC